MDQEQAVQNTDDENEKKEEFTPREYQIEILEKAKKENTVACLGTGTGKTFIAVLLIKEMAHEVQIPFEDGGKRIFFLVPTVPLVVQQARVIKNHTELEVKGYYGEMGIDMWSAEQWSKEFEKYQVLVMTAEICRIILFHNFLTVSRFALLILDECHQARGRSPYSEIMKFIADEPMESRPRIFGLSASLINNKCKPHRLEKELNELEVNLMSKITTATDYQDVLKYGTDAKEFIILYEDFEIPHCYDNIIGCMNSTFSEIRSEENHKKAEKKTNPEIEELHTLNILRFWEMIDEVNPKPEQCLKQVITLLQNVGPWCAYHGAKFLCKGLENSAGKVNEQTKVTVVKIISALQEFIRVSEQYEMHIFQKDFSNIPHKLQKFVEIIRALKEWYHKMKEIENDALLKNSESNISFQEDPAAYSKNLKNDSNSFSLCGIIFVKERVMAYVLYKWLEELCKVDSQYDFIKSECIFGQGYLRRDVTDKQFYMSANKQKEIIKGFRNKDFNFLVATSVLEEGLDVQKCNFVIRFDFPDNFKSYIQSKGRARAKDSRYILFVSNMEKEFRYPDLVNFKSIEEMLKKSVFISESDIEVGKTGKDDDIPYHVKITDSGRSVISASSAVSLLHRYCAILPSDVSVNLKPHFVFEVVDPQATKKEFKCLVFMPINCVIHEPIIGPKMGNKSSARRAAALEACKKLDELGELDDHLLPQSVDFAIDLAAEKLGIIPEEDCSVVNAGKPGTSKRRRFYKKEVAKALQNNIPEPDIPYYLHIFEMDLITPLPLCLNPRKRPIINPADTTEGFGLLSTKILPKVCKFPVFTKCGKILVDIQPVCKPILLSKASIDRIKLFHNFVFKDTLWLTTSCMDFLPQSAEFSTYIVPINKGRNKDYILDMDIVERSLLHNYNEEKDKKFKEIRRKKFEKDVFKDAVVTKAYHIYRWKTEKPVFYHLTQICYDMSPLSPMPNRELLYNYKDHYKFAYDVYVKYYDQPMLDVHRVQSLNMFRPMYTSINQIFVEEESGNQSKTKTSHQSYREYLIPELCLIHPFPDPLFRKATYLPTILFRLNNLLIAEQIRHAVAKEYFVGIASLSNEFQWPAFHLETSDYELRQRLIAGSHIPRENFDIIDKPMDIIKDNDGKITSYEACLDLRHHSGPNPAILLQALTSKKAGDEFNLERLETIGDSFLKYATSVKLFSMFPNFDEGKLTAIRIRVIKNLNLYQLMEKKNLSNYVMNLKFSCNTSHPNKKKSKLAKTKLNVEYANWLPPCYISKDFVHKKFESEKSDCSEALATYVPKNYVTSERDSNVNILPDNEENDNIEDMVISEYFNEEQRRKKLKMDCSEESYSGQDSDSSDSETLSSVSNNSCNNKPDNMAETSDVQNENKEKSKIIPHKTFYTHQIISDKCIADSAEALIGAYLLSCGQRGALHFMHYLGVSPFITFEKDGENQIDFENWPPIPPNPRRKEISLVQPMENLLNFNEFEERIGYKFKEPAYLLQAFTHASYDVKFNDLTDCYQRLEFLGDAILDYLVTRTLYEWPKKHTPGEMTDLRAALVNNAFFASLAVKYGFHKNLRSLSPTLYKLIEQYAELLENSESFKIFKEHGYYAGDYGYYSEENECDNIDEIEVPKALGDIVESVAGAIYLDSGSSLDTVWRVYHRMMKPSIDHLCEYVPKSPVRELYELTDNQKIFQDITVKDNKTYILVKLKDGKEFTGVGPSKKVAKTSVAKKAVLYLKMKMQKSRIEAEKLHKTSI